MRHELHPTLASKTALHSETLARLGLFKSYEEQTSQTSFVTDTISESRQTIKGSGLSTAKLLMASQSKLNPHNTLQVAAES